MTTLTQRILDCADDMRVCEIVDQTRMDALPANIAALFGPMQVVWGPNRSWGLSFQIGDPCVTIGHRRGDHLATYPWLHNLSAKEAERLLCAQIEGTLLHELGHAIFDLYLKAHDGYKQAAKAALKDGPPSAYRGHEIENMSANELLHEMFAESFRYWCHRDDNLQAMFPTWDRLVSDAVDYAADDVI